MIHLHIINYSMAKDKKNTQDEKERTSLFLKTDMIRSIKYVCFMDEKNQTQVVEEALTDYLAKWEKKNGPVPPPKA